MLLHTAHRVPPSSAGTGTPTQRTPDLAAAALARPEPAAASGAHAPGAEPAPEGTDPAASLLPDPIRPEPCPGIPTGGQHDRRLQEARLKECFTLLVGHVLEWHLYEGDAGLRQRSLRCEARTAVGTGVDGNDLAGHDGSPAWAVRVVTGHRRHLDQAVEHPQGRSAAKEPGSPKREKFFGEIRERATASEKFSNAVGRAQRAGLRNRPRWQRGLFTAQAQAGAPQPASSASCTTPTGPAHSCGWTPQWHELRGTCTEIGSTRQERSYLHVPERTEIHPGPATHALHGARKNVRHAAAPRVSVSAPCSVEHMSTTRQRNTGGGRRGKGDRHPFAVRLPREYADRVIAFAEATDQSYNDVIVDQIIKHIDELDAAVVELGSNRLDIAPEVKTG